MNALLHTGFYLLVPQTWQILNQITKNLIGNYQWNGKFRKTLVMIVGFSGSGKSTLVNGNQDLGNFFRIHADAIHEQLNAEFKFLQDDKTINGPGFWPRHILTLIVRIKLLREISRQGIPIILESCNLLKKERSTVGYLLKKAGYRIIMIHVDCPEKELLRRIEEREKKNEAEGMPRKWLNLYHKFQKPLFERPCVTEASQLIHFWSGQQRPSEVSSWISWIEKLEG